MHVSVSANALQALGRIALRSQVPIRALACPRLSDSRWQMRAAALRVLRLTAERCDRDEELDLLNRDPAEFVRQSAAALVRDVSRGPSDERALVRTRDRDASSAVAAESEALPFRKLGGVEPTVVVVIPAADDLPRPNQPFGLLRADGLVRWGVSDRRGQLFEVAAPRGPVTLIDLGTDFE